MKKYLFSLLIFFINTLWCSAQKSISGIWQGKLNAGVSLTLIFHFSQDANHTWQASIDCPEQHLKELKASAVSLNGDSIKVEVKQIGGSYDGRLINDSTIDGSWVQGVSIPLLLKRSNAAPAEQTLKRPQTPQRPFPAILLITGSGQQDRDEEILGHRPFAVIADYLTRKGYVVLRVDDRGKGKTTGDVMTATSKDFSEDAEVSLEYLKSRKETDKGKIGLIGHSEGGMIAEMIAAKRKDISFIIMLAGPGVKITQLMHEQSATILANKLPKDYIDAYLTLYDQLLNAIITYTPQDVRSRITSLVDNWVNSTPANMVLATTGIRDSTSKQAYINLFIQQAGSPWFIYFLKYDPAFYLQKVSAHVLALNGDKDIQVISKSNLPAIEAALKKSSSKKFEVKELKGLNHLFQHCITCTIAEYGTLEETIAPEVLEEMANWLIVNN
jgi:hypothetical protein